MLFLELVYVHRNIISCRLRLLVLRVEKSFHGVFCEWPHHKFRNCIHSNLESKVFHSNAWNFTVAYDMRISKTLVTPSRTIWVWYPSSLLDAWCTTAPQSRWTIVLNAATCENTISKASFSRKRSFKNLYNGDSFF